MHLYNNQSIKWFTFKTLQGYSMTAGNFGPILNTIVECGRVFIT